MKKSLFIITFFFLNFSFAQTVMSIEKSEQIFRRDSLQEIYFYQIMSDDISECFEVSPEMFLAEWSKFSREVAKYLKDQNFLFGKQTKGLTEVYFSAEGTIDLLFYSLRDANYEAEFYQKLENHLLEFCKNYKFTIKAKIPFTNTGGIIFMH
jgi:hypothetical protein